MRAESPARTDATPQSADSSAHVFPTLLQIERDVVHGRMRMFDGRVDRAAESLGLTENTLREKLDQYLDIDRTLEANIEQVRAELLGQRDHAMRAEINRRLTALIMRRSPEQVRRMEPARGLA